MDPANQELVNQYFSRIAQAVGADGPAATATASSSPTSRIGGIVAGTQSLHASVLNTSLGQASTSHTESSRSPGIPTPGTSYGST